MDLPINPFQAPGKIGPMGINWLIEHPRLFTSFPRSLQDRMAYRAIRPAGSSWLRSRTAPATIKPGCHAVSSSAVGDKVHLKLNDGTESVVDHVLFGTGYRVSVARMNYLSADLSQTIQTVKGYPVLNRGFESSIRGLYFVGASGAYLIRSALPLRGRNALHRANLGELRLKERQETAAPKPRCPGRSERSAAGLTRPAGGQARA